MPRQKSTPHRSEKRRRDPRTPIARPHHLERMARKPGVSEVRSAPSEFMRVSRVAKLLDVSAKRIYFLIDEGRLEAIRLGPRQIRVPRRSLDQFIERHLME